jgi:hypothetical protein
MRDTGTISGVRLTAARTRRIARRLDAPGTRLRGTMHARSNIVFVKMRPVGAELFHADGQTDMTKLMVVFRNFANAPTSKALLAPKCYDALEGVRALSSHFNLQDVMKDKRCFGALPWERNSVVVPGNKRAQGRVRFHIIFGMSTDVAVFWSWLIATSEYGMR